MIGLLGVGYDGVLYTPAGKKIIRLPLWLSQRIKNTWDRLARLTWR